MTTQGSHPSVLMNDTILEIRHLLSGKLFIDVDSPETDLLNTGLLDSLALVQLLVHLEERFGVRIALDAIEIEDLRSVASIAALVLKQQPELAAAK
ncbi:MAG TPA: acyl carrier protein [Bryobacteraceae bacterium]|nr:acyl carrier protein [Bryobacteraceae bacterium]